MADRAMLLPGRRRCRGRVLRTLKDQVAARLQIIGHRWVLCPRRAIARARGPEIGQAAAMSPIVRTQELGPPEATLLTDRTQELGPAQATSPIGRTQVLGQALARVQSLDHDQEPAHDHQHAMCKIFLICQMPVAGMLGMSALADHQAASVTPLRSPAARWPAEQLQNSCKIVRAMRFRAQAVLEIESMRVYPANPEIESMPACRATWKSCRCRSTRATGESSRCRPAGATWKSSRCGSSRSAGQSRGRGSTGPTRKSSRCRPARATWKPCGSWPAGAARPRSTRTSW